jgi:uncharacterized protein (DUF2235 family)
MPKNIIICLDGTGNEFGDANSNVIKMYSAIQLREGNQVSYYHPGLGTRGAPNALTKLAKWWTKVLGLAFGYGLADNLAAAYSFLMNEYRTGDRVFIFGFSRGAYTARALCGMLRMFGLLRQHQEVLIPYMIRMMRNWNDQQVFRIAGQFKKTFSRECKPHFVGLWDTVSSVGWIYNPVKVPYTAKNKDIAIGRHAVAIDERRCFYRQNLWNTADAGQDIQQFWFAGVHSDIGGGYEEKESGLSKITLQWMIEEARQAGLLFDDFKVQRILGQTDSRFTSPDAAADPHKSLHGFWWLLEFWPRRYAVRSRGPDGQWRRRWKLPMGESRYIRPGSAIHESVYERMRRLPAYRPRNLPENQIQVSSIA